MMDDELQVMTMREPFPRATVEAHASSANTPGWAFAAARQVHRWAIGTEITREQYDAAIHSVMSAVIR